MVLSEGAGPSPGGDEAMVAKIRGRMGADRAFLFGRRTYEDLLLSWNTQGGPFKDALDNSLKYIASSNAATRLDWPNSTLLMIHPLVLGTGRRLFAGGTQTSLRLVDSSTTGSGVLIAMYEPAAR